MKNTTRGFIGAGVLFITCASQAQIDTSGLQLVRPDQLPKFGTYWLANAPGGRTLPPLPFPPANLDVPIYALTNGQFLVDDTEVSPDAQWQSVTRTRVGGMSTMSIPIPGDGGTPGDPPTPPPDIPNYQKFMGHAFSVIDTNDAAANDTNLYNVCVSFPEDTNTVGTLQVAWYGTNAVIIKASHFDYSAETRDFALIICDRVDRPVWKNIDLSGSSDTQDGWLIQGAISDWRVADPMFLMVSNINLAYNAFFRAIPYDGPQVQIVGAQPYETVSNTVTLRALISDLSGTTTTNQHMTVTVNGLSARCAVGPSNTIALDTRYAQSGSEEVEVVVSSLPVVFDPQNPPMDTRLEFDTTATLPLDFENPAFLVNASDLSSLEVGTNYILFGISQPDEISATISEPSSGRIVASYSGYVPSAATVYLDWNFTEADGVTPYTNDTYHVHFVANDPTTLDITNRIDKEGVRVAGGVILTYAEEANNWWLNQQAYTWVNQTLSFLYNDIYDQWGLTQYYWWDIGDGRNLTTCYSDTPNTPNGWRDFMTNALASPLYSDITIGPMHGSATAIAATGGEAARTWDLASWTLARAPNWRMRKAAVWSCFSGEGYIGSPTAASPTGYPWFPDAFGVRPWGVQHGGFMKKNSCLCFKKDWSQDLNVAEVVEAFDQLWVAGPNAYPGGCDPTWSILWAMVQTQDQFSWMSDAKPFIAGYQWLIYTSAYDEDLMHNDYSHVHGRVP